MLTKNNVSCRMLTRHRATRHAACFRMYQIALFGIPLIVAPAPSLLGRSLRSQRLVAVVDLRSANRLAADGRHLLEVVTTVTRDVDASRTSARPRTAPARRRP
jgi:hypothetical protein